MPLLDRQHMRSWRQHFGQPHRPCAIVTHTGPGQQGFLITIFKDVDLGRRTALAVKQRLDFHFCRAIGGIRQLRCRCIQTAWQHQALVDPVA
ncbi:hypothetical protein D3C84_804820 [compost metagenome]